MTCYSPWLKKGDVVGRPLSCGQCHGCRLERSRQWAVRCMHEASLYDSNCFITLTFRDASVMSLDYVFFQLFMKRLRARFSRARIRFFMCGEYGEEFSRPHFHACLFNFSFPDLVYLRTTDSGSKLYRSAILEDLWPLGFSSVGAVTFESAAYVARYVMKKISGSETHHDIIDPNSGEVFRRVKEFGRMSLKPGIGAMWIERYMQDVYPRGMVIVNGHEARPPRFYDKRFRAKDAGGYMRMAHARNLEQDRHFADTVPSRLEARSKVAVARLGLLKRKI